MKTNEKGYLLCPVCGEKTKTRVNKGTTELKAFPLWCPWCRKEYIINHKARA